ncbi:MAG: tetratricopeptide repeat protein [Anaerolineales bacterium]|nr:tetratricopeptide repeat protein [Anaerolineales bacterium]
MTQNPDQLKEEGLQQFQRGNYEAALEVFETAVSLYTSTNNPSGQAEMLNNIGVIYRLHRNLDAAVDALSQAETLFGRIGDVERQGMTLGNLGDLYVAQKKHTEAARSYSNASERLAQAGARDKQSQVLRALSLMRLRQGQWLQAMMHMEESLSVRPRVGLGGWIFRGLLRFVLRLMRGE